MSCFAFRNRSLGRRSDMTATPLEKASTKDNASESGRSVGSTRASTNDNASESGRSVFQPAGFADNGLKDAIKHHFARMVSTQETRNGMLVSWSAGHWNALYWATANMEDGITQLFTDLGQCDILTAMKGSTLKTNPGQKRINNFWLPVWKFRLDRDAKNGRLALSPCPPNTAFRSLSC